MCGTPIVVTDHTGTGEDVKKLEAGYLVKLDDIENLATVFEYILDNYAEAKIKTLKARQYIIDNLSMKSRVREYYELFD